MGKNEASIIVKAIEARPDTVIVMLFVLVLLVIAYKALDKVVKQFASAQSDRDKLMRDFQREQQEMLIRSWDAQQQATNKTLKDISDGLRLVIETVQNHDSKTDKAIAVMQDRSSKRHGGGGL